MTGNCSSKRWVQVGVQYRIIPDRLMTTGPRSGHCMATIGSDLHAGTGMGITWHPGPPPVPTRTRTLRESDAALPSPGNFKLAAACPARTEGVPAAGGWRLPGTQGEGRGGREGERVSSGHRSSRHVVVMPGVGGGGGK